MAGITVLGMTGRHDERVVRGGEQSRGSVGQKENLHAVVHEKSGNIALGVGRHL